MSDPAFGPSPTLPASFGRYHVVAVIPGGNMGRLYLAKDREIDRTVVVKALDGQRTREEHLRFLREARAAGRLSHANVVSVFDVGEENGTPFIVMEYIDGETLAAVIKARAPLLLSRKLELADQLCAGLAYAHDQGVVHRDVKPSNLMIDKADVLRILDFGIARVDAGEQTQTSSGVVGTLNYMSPEQWEGGVVDQRSDIFAVGAVMYELCTYARAFPGNTPPEVMRAVYGDGPPRLDEAAPDVPRELSDIVHRMMARHPDDRYPSLHVVRAALAELKEPMRAAEAQMLGETVRLDRPKTATRSVGTGWVPSSTSIDKTASVIREMRTARRTGTPDSSGAPVDAAAPPAARSPRNVVLGIAAVLALIAVGIVGVLAWQGQFGTAQPGPPPSAAGNVSVAPPPITPPDPPATQQPSGAPASSPQAGNAGRSEARVGASSTQVAPKITRIKVSGTYAFELRQGGKVISESATQHELDVDLNRGEIRASNVDYLLNAVISPRNSPVEIPAHGFLIVLAPPAVRTACRLIVDTRDMGSPQQQTPGLELAAGTHKVGLRCDGSSKVETEEVHEIKPGGTIQINAHRKAGIQP